MADPASLRPHGEQASALPKHLLRVPRSLHSLLSSACALTRAVLALGITGLADLFRPLSAQASLQSVLTFNGNRREQTIFELANLLGSVRTFV
eukprot:4531678-Pleurochrysis_carterae.AAC.1